MADCDGCVLCTLAFCCTAFEIKIIQVVPKSNCKSGGQLEKGRGRVSEPIPHTHSPIPPSPPYPFPPSPHPMARPDKPKATKKSTYYSLTVFRLLGKHSESLLVQKSHPHLEVIFFLAGWPRALLPLDQAY